MTTYNVHLTAIDELLFALEATEGALSSFVEGNPEPSLRAVEAICDMAQATISKVKEDIGK